MARTAFIIVARAPFDNADALPLPPPLAQLLDPSIELFPPLAESIPF